MRTLSLNPKVAKVSPYIDDTGYLYYIEKTTKMRTRKSSNEFYRLFNKQKGLCLFCNTPLKPYLDDLNNENPLLDIHHIKPLSIGGSHSDINHKSLLHKDCHKLCHMEQGTQKVTYLPYSSQ